MLIPVFDCSSLGTSMLKWLGSSHTLKFSGIQVTSPGGNLLILITNSSRHKEPKIRVLESTEFRGWVSGNDSKWGCSFFHILVLKSYILSIGNIALYNNGYFWFRLDTMIIKCTTRSSALEGGFFYHCLLGLLLSGAVMQWQSFWLALTYKVDQTMNLIWHLFPSITWSEATLMKASLWAEREALEQLMLAIPGKLSRWANSSHTSSGWGV